MPHPRCSLLAPGLLFSVATFLHAAAPPAQVNPTDEKTLRSAGLPFSGPGLLTYLRKRTLTASQRRRVRELIPKLGDDVFQVRHRASLDLLALGPGIVPHLRAALGGPDEEIQERLRSLLAALKKENDPAISGAAVRLLRVRAPAGTIEGLLDYLPDAANTAVANEVLATLATLGVSDGKVAPALLQALKDAEPARRGAAAAVLGRSRNREQRATIQRLLSDASPLVRFRAAQGMLAGRDRAGIPTLIALLTEGTPDLAAQADELLSCMAGARAPRLAPGGDAASRRRCRTAWSNWWRFNTHLDLTRADVDLPGFNDSLRCRAAARQFLAAVLDAEPEIVRKGAEMPFLMGGEQLVNEMAELEGLRLAPIRQLLGDPVTSPFSSEWVIRQLDNAPRTVSATERAFLARYRKGEVHVLEMLTQTPPPGAPPAGILVLVRLVGGRVRVIGLDASRWASQGGGF